MDVNEWSPAVRPGAWAAVDTGLLRHRKLAGLKGRADVLYLACVLHCADELTDGRVRGHAVRRLVLDARARRADFGELVAAGLLEVAADGDGWNVVGYLEWNPPRAWWDRRRVLGRERQARYREASARRKAHGEGTRNALGDGRRNALGDAGDVTRDREGVSRPLAARGRTCPVCGVTVRPPTTVAEHVERFHGEHQAQDVEHQGDNPGTGEGGVQTVSAPDASPSSSRTPGELESLLRTLR